VKVGVDVVVGIVSIAFVGRPASLLKPLALISINRYGKDALGHPENDFV
jgi:hypothetical protein